MNLIRSSIVTLLWTAAIVSLAAMGQARAQEKIMVVFDASGSMWGQIDGVSKIEIARSTLKRTIRDWKGLDLEAGLIVYGHRRKGDCGDIELKIPSGPINTRSFSAAVDKIKPRGKTPLTQAVREAAESLKYTEEKATVILLSDGKETCDLDPCAVARELESNGVDFTTHVIGFDVAKREEKRQLQCLAENTGGLFVSAKDANELVVAFQRVVEPRPFAFRAVRKGEGGPVPGPVTWSAKGGDVNISQTTDTARLEIPDLPDGRYDVSAVAGPFKGRATYNLGKDRPNSLVLPMVAEAPKASVEGPDSVPANEEFSVTWQGPGGKGDKIQLSRPGAVPGSSFVQSIDASKGSPLTFRAPAKQGRYELRYYSGSLRKLLAQRPITVGKPKPTAFLTALDEVPAGATFEVKWDGPGHEKDWIGLATPKMKARQHKTYAYTNKGNPVSLRAPSKPGVYELRYVNGTEHKIMGRRKLTVVPADMELVAVDRVKGGATFEVKWKGPGHERDWIGLATPKMKPRKHKSYAYVRTGNPVTMRAPTAPGDYELRYIHAGDSGIMIRRKLIVEPSGAGLSALDEVLGGQSFEVKWEGPGHERDWIGIAKPKDKAGKHKSYAYARTGNPVTLRAPTASGEYEIRYVNASEVSVMARRKLIVKPGGVTLAAVDEIQAGRSFEVQWKGPGNDRDWIGIARPKDKPGKHKGYAYTRTGNPVTLRAPTAPGDYELRYINSGENTVMARRKLTVTPGGVTLEAVSEIAAGEPFDVTWNGPGHERDWVGVALPKARAGTHKGYAYTRSGNPAKLRAPSKPGDYELRYVNASDNSVMQRQPLKVLPPAVKLETIEGIPAGHDFEVKWTGPNTGNDYVSISLPKAKSGAHKSYAYTRKGNPSAMRAPSKPGTYEVRYINGNDRGTLARKLIEVGPSTASIEAVDRVRAGATFEAKWTGPGNSNDWLEIARPGSKPGKYVSYVYIRRGNPAEMRAPAETGDYVIRYINGNDRSSPLATRKLVVDGGG